MTRRGAATPRCQGRLPIAGPGGLGNGHRIQESWQAQNGMDQHPDLTGRAAVHPTRSTCVTAGDALRYSRIQLMHGSGAIPEFAFGTLIPDRLCVLLLAVTAARYSLGHEADRLCGKVRACHDASGYPKPSPPRFKSKAAVLPGNRLGCGSILKFPGGRPCRSKQSMRRLCD